jgi:hypothetical protein
MTISKSIWQEGMTKAEKERDNFETFNSDHNIEFWQEGMAFSLWQINNSLEKLIKIIKEKA